MMPFKNPTVLPARSAIIIDIGSGIPAFKQNAQMIPPKLVIAPIERSMPPADIRKVIGTATINEKLAVRRMSKISFILKNCVDDSYSYHQNYERQNRSHFRLLEKNF